MILTFSSIALTFILYLLHHLTTKSQSYNLFFTQHFGTEIGQVKMILSNRFLGAFMFGVIPLLIVIFLLNKDLPSFGTAITSNFYGLFFFLIFGTIASIVNFFVARSPENLKMYPQIRCNEWSILLTATSALSWIIYLIGYEFMFRGFLFNSCIIELGLWPAIFINIAIYSITHIPKGFREAIGAIPMGLVLCLVTYLSGSIWVAIAIHASLSLSNEWFSIKYSSQIVIKK